MVQYFLYSPMIPFHSLTTVYVYSAQSIVPYVIELYCRVTSGNDNASERNETAVGDVFNRFASPRLLLGDESKTDFFCLFIFFL